MKLPLIPVRLGNGIVVLHSRQEFERLIRGCVDPETATAAMSTTPLEDDDAPRPEA